ncbi:conserved hypothetical protein, partial [Vibrio parahaemolyticus AQ3810]
CDVLLFDARKEFDANSFTAAIGSLVGGGMLLVVTNTAQPQHFAEQWMQTQWQSSFKNRSVVHVDSKMAQRLLSLIRLVE